MAFSEIPQFISLVSETTLTTAYLYRMAYLTSDGMVNVGGAWTTGPKQAPVGVYYGGGGKTTSTQLEAVQIGVGGILKVKFTTDSTNVPGQFVCASSGGYGTSPSTSNFIVGMLVALTTGGEHNVGSVLWNPVPFKGPKLGDISSTADT